MLNAELNGDGSSLKQTVRRGSVGNLKSQIPNLKQTDKRIKEKGKGFAIADFGEDPSTLLRAGGSRRFQPRSAIFSHFLSAWGGWLSEHCHSS
jgi:hypothetical protein